MEPMQFAYRSNRKVEDATLISLNLLRRHLKQGETRARLLFVDFSSVFNSTQPHVLAEKLMFNFSLDFSLMGWMLDFLTNRPQRVRVTGVLKCAIQLKCITIIMKYYLEIILF